MGWGVGVDYITIPLLSRFQGAIVSRHRPFNIASIQDTKMFMISKIARFSRLKQLIPEYSLVFLGILIDASTSLSSNAELPLNVRSTTIYFLEQLGDSFSKFLVKKDAGKL